MCLLITVLAAAVSTLLWRLHKNSEKLGLSGLCLIYWGAAIMWFADTIFKFCESGVEIFTPTPSEMFNDTLLGLCVTALGIIIHTLRMFCKKLYASNVGADGWAMFRRLTRFIGKDGQRL